MTEDSIPYCAHVYERLPISCDCSGVSLEKAALRLGPAFIYQLHVNPQAFLYTMALLKKFGADTKDHPMSPYVNLVSDDTLTIYEWYLSAHDRAVGSEGVGCCLIGGGI